MAYPDPICDLALADFAPPRPKRRGRKWSGDPPERFADRQCPDACCLFWLSGYQRVGRLYLNVPQKAKARS